MSRFGVLGPSRCQRLMRPSPFKSIFSGNPLIPSDASLLDGPVCSEFYVKFVKDLHTGKTAKKLRFLENVYP